MLAVAEARAAQPRWAARPVAERVLRCCCGCTTWCSPGSPRCSTWSSWRTARRAATPTRRSPTSRSSRRHYARRGARVPRDPPPAGHLVPGADRHHRASAGPQGVVGVISPWNYPLTLGDLRRPARAGGRQRRGAQARLADRADRAVGGRPAAAGRAARGPGPGRVRARRRDRRRAGRRTSTTSASPARPPPGKIVAAQAAARLVGVLARARRQEHVLRRRRRADRAWPPSARCVPSSPARASCASRSSGSSCTPTSTTSSWTRSCAACDKIRLGSGLDYGADMGSLDVAGPARHGQPARRRRGVEGRHRAGRRQAAAGRRSAVLRAHRAGRRARARRRVTREETFGPVVAVYTVGSDDEAVAFANRPGTD